MSGHYHAIIWIDHREARVFHFNAAEVEPSVLRPRNPAHQVHHKANTIGSGHAAEDHTYFEEVAAAIAGAGAILITGPSNAKTELAKHLRAHHPKLMDKVAGVEPMDHPTDGALVDYARRYFKAADRLAP